MIPNSDERESYRKSKMMTAFYQKGHVPVAPQLSQQVKYKRSTRTFLSFSLFIENILLRFKLQ